MAALETLPPAQQAQIQELRLRTGQAVAVSTPLGERYLGRDGVSSVMQSDTFICTAAMLEACFLRLCDEAVYAHEWELQQGFLSVTGGIRVGVAGTAVMEHGRVRTVRDITSLCIRLPRHIPGCADHLRRRMLATGFPANTLVVGPPSSGKTTLLRDLAAGLGARGYRVTVVDERGELSGLCPLTGCDVLLGYPKAEGIHRAVRCLAPDVVVFDELGDAEEAAAVVSCARNGVGVAASLHGYDPAALVHQPLPRLLAENRAFDLWCFMTGRRCPGAIKGWYQAEVEHDAVCWVPVDCPGGSGDGGLWEPSPAPTGGLSARHSAAVAGVGAAATLYRPTDDRPVAEFSVVGCV